METLGDQPVVVAHARQMQDFVTLIDFLRRNPNRAAIQTAIAETVASGIGLASITPKTKRVIRTEPVQMTDGRIHAVHVWCGRTDVEPPERPVPGLLKWDPATGEGSATAEYLANSGMATQEPAAGGTFAEYLPGGGLDPTKSEVLSWSTKAEPGKTYCTTWDFTDLDGVAHRLGWCARTLLETDEDGTEHVVGRALNLRETVETVEEAPPAEVSEAPDTAADTVLD